MTASRSQDMARLEARVSPEVKALLERAAGIQGVTLTSFLISSAQKAASDIVERYESLQLGQRDSEAFVDALLNPPEPNEALKAAASRYQTLVES